MPQGHPVPPQAHAHKVPANVQKFIEAHLAEARSVSASSGIPVSVILAQSGFETGWGSSKVMVVKNAWFAVKGAAPDGASTRFATHEVEHGVRRPVKGKFRAYSSFTAAAKNYASVLKLQYPLAFRDSSDGLKFVTHLVVYKPDGKVKYRYATNPHYVGTLQKIIKEFLMPYNQVWDPKKEPKQESKK